MIYLLPFILLLTCAAGAMIAFVVAIVFAFKRRWRFTLIATFCTLFFSLLSVLPIVVIVRLAAAHIRSTIASNEAAYQKRLDARSAKVKSLTPTVDFSKVDEQWFNYDGFRDWWRVPIRYPYEIHSIDELTRGSLYKNIVDGKSDASSPQWAQFPTSDITDYTFDSQMLLYRQEDRTNPVTFHLFHFDTEKDESFPTEAALDQAAQSANFSAPLRLQSIQENYDNYWSR